MGFFSSLCNGIKKVANVAKDVVKNTAILTIGGPIAVGVWAAEKAGLISTTEEVSKEVAKTEALTDESSAQQVENIADTLSQYYEKSRSDAERRERRCQEMVDTFFDDLIRRLEEQEEIADNVGIGRLQRRKRELCSQIRGAITEPMARRLSIDDAECRQILQLPKGAAKDRRITDYSKRVVLDASDDLSRRTCDAIQEQWDDTAKFLKEYIKQREKEAEQQKQLLKAWEKDMESDNFNKEKTQLVPSVKLYAWNQIEKIIEA